MSVTSLSEFLSYTNDLNSKRDEIIAALRNYENEAMRQLKPHYSTRTLQEITDAARRGEPATEEELRLAVCAYDVFISRIELENDPKRLAEFFMVAESKPREYLGPANDPNNPECVAWHKAFINTVDDA